MSAAQFGTLFDHAIRTPYYHKSLSFPEFVDFLGAFALTRYAAGVDDLEDLAHGEDAARPLDTDRAKVQAALDRLDVAGRYFRGNDEYFHAEAYEWARRHDAEEKAGKARATGSFKVRLSGERDERRRRQQQAASYSHVKYM